MRISGCFAKGIAIDPRLPFATLTTSQSAPEVYAIKIISTYQNFSTVTNPATVTMSIGLLADARVVMVFARHLDNFVVT
jgi:hypothetical protein